MTEHGSALKRAAMKMGAWMLIGGALILGPIGFLLICALAYAMYFSNFALGVVCIMVLASPLVFLGLWALLGGAALIAEGAGARDVVGVEAEAEVT
ncbi:MAG: hypothetical protein FJ118_06945 [Deltaproteobacteria bacterium]|nr:hypothetical protein [Deltaproteobacteria bacterium]